MALIDKLTAIADAIRGKTGNTEKLTLDQMASEAGVGIEVYFTPHGVAYTPNVVSAATIIVSGVYKGADKLVSIELTEWNPTYATHLQSVNNANLSDAFGSPSLETLLLPKLQYGGHYWARGATGLKRVQLGSIGYPVNGGLGVHFFSGCVQTGLEITVYTEATTLVEISETFKEAPWGATNATIIYRNSTTGEVITE